MPPRARLIVGILGVVAIAAFMVDFAVDNTWLFALAIGAWFGAMVISYNYRPQTPKQLPTEPDTRNL